MSEVAIRRGQVWRCPKTGRQVVPLQNMAHVNQPETWEVRTYSGSPEAYRSSVVTFQGERSIRSLVLEREAV